MTEHEMYELLSLLDRQGKAGVPNCAEAAAEIRNLQSELATAQEIRSKGMSYILQDQADPSVTLKSGGRVHPLATLKNEYGGISHIVNDDHCYVLVNGSESGGFQTVKHWYREAVEALKTLPTPH